MNKAKILFIITRNDKGGAFEFLSSLIDSLKLDYHVTIIYGGIKSDYSVDSFYVKEFVRKVNFIYDFVSFVKVIFLIFKYKPDIIHTHTSKAGFIGRISGFIYKIFINSKVRLIHTPHGHIFYGYFGKIKTFFFLTIERLLSFLTDVFVALTENEKIESIKYGVGKEDRWIIIPSGIKYDFFYDINNCSNLRKKLKISENDIVVGSVMRLEDVKGDKYFVLAANYIVNFLNKKIHFVLVGDGSNRRKLEKLVEKFKISNYFHFVGWQNNVYDWINIMNIYVQPSLNEGLGRTVIYAELLYKPIIASSVCGLRDLVVDGYNGILVPPADYYKLAFSILRLIENQNLIKKMGENSFKHVNREFDGFKIYSFERSVYLHRKLYNSF